MAIFHSIYRLSGGIMQRTVSFFGCIFVVGFVLVGGCASTIYSESECGIKPSNYEEIVRQWHTTVEKDGNSLFRVESISPPEPNDRASGLPGWHVTVTDSYDSAPERLTDSNGSSLGVKPLSDSTGSSQGTFVSVHQERTWVLTIRDGKVVDAKTQGG
jgi:hypothetical protein